MRNFEKALRFEHDPAADAVYIRFAEPQQGQIKATVPIERGDDLLGALDLDGDGRIVGIELLGVSIRLPPDLVAEST